MFIGVLGIVIVTIMTTMAKTMVTMTMMMAAMIMMLVLMTMMPDKAKSKRTACCQVVLSFLARDLLSGAASRSQEKAI